LQPGALVNSTTASWKSAYLSDPAGILEGSQLLLWYFGSSPSATPQGAFVGGVGLAYCSLVTVLVKTSQTTTFTRTSTVVGTATLTSTVSVPSAASPA
jgi:hypothetical protein